MDPNKTNKKSHHKSLPKLTSLKDFWIKEYRFSVSSRMCRGSDSSAEHATNTEVNLAFFTRIALKVHCLSPRRKLVLLHRLHKKVKIFELLFERKLPLLR